eukprot:6491074-Amphidinium_carterae.1
MDQEPVTHEPQVHVNSWLLQHLACLMLGGHAGISSIEAGPHVDETGVWDIYPQYYDEVYDNITGVKLDPVLVARGREEEMAFLDSMKAYEYSTVDECMNATNRKPIPVGWVDVNKGDKSNPSVRCRLVVKETRHHSTISDPSQTWSATPPYEALRFMCSMTMSPLRGEEDFVLQFVDISRAHPHCVMKRDLWIELPMEDKRSSERNLCGKLLRCLYGTRDAGQSFELKVHEVMVDQLHFKAGLWSPCLFRNEQHGLQSFVYGDNFVTRRSRDELSWFFSELSKHLKAKLEGTLGPDASRGAWQG